MKRAAKWALGLGGLGLLGTVLLGGGGLLWLRTESGNKVLLRIGLGWVNSHIPGAVTVDGLATDLYSEARLTRVRLEAPDGSPLLAADEIVVTLALPGIEAISLDGVEVWVDLRPDGSVPWFEVVDGELLGWLPTMDVPQVEATGTAWIGSEPLEDLSLTSRLTLGSTLSFSEVQLGARTTHLPDPVTVSGSAGFDGTHASAELEVSAAGSEVNLTGSVSAEGPDGRFDGVLSLAPLMGPDASGSLNRSADGEALPVSGAVAGTWQALSGTAELPGATAAVTGDLGARTWTAEVTLSAFEPPIETALAVLADGSCQLSGDHLEGSGRCGLDIASGQITAQVDAPVVLTDGRLVLEGIAIETLGGRLLADATASVDGLDAEVTGTLPLSGLGVPGASGQASIEATATGRPEAIDLAGIVRAIDVGLHDITIASVDVPFSGRIAEDTVQVRANATVGTLRAAGFEVQGARAPVSVSWAGGGARIRGPFETGPITGAVSSEGASGHLDATGGPGVILSARFDAVTRIATRGLTADVVADGHLRGDQVHLVAAVDALDVDVDAVADIDLGDGWVELPTVDVQPAEGDPWSLTQPGRAHLGPDGVTDLDLVLQVDAGTVAVSGGLDALEFRADAVPLAVARQVEPDAPRISGTASADLFLTDSLSGTVLLDEVGLSGLDATFLLDAGALEGAVRRDDVHLAHVSGEIGTDLRDPIALVLTAEGVDLAAFPELGLPVYPEASARVEVTGPLTALEVAGTGSVEGVGTTTDLQLHRDGPRMRLTGETRAGETILATFEGSALSDLDAIAAAVLEDGAWPEVLVGDLTGDAVLDEVPVVDLVRYAGLDADVAGTISGTANLRDGRPGAEVVWDDARLGTVEVPGAQVSFADGDLDLVTHFVTRVPDGRRGMRTETGGFTAKGSLPIRIDPLRRPVDWVEAPVDLVLDGKGIPMGALSAVHPTLKQGSGWLVLSGRVAGTPEAPDIHASAELDGGAVTVRELGLRARGVRLRASVDGNDVVIDELVAHTRPSKNRRRRAPSGRPSLTASGSARIGVEGVTDIDGAASLHNALVISRNDQHAWLSTTDPLVLGGRLDALTVAGGLKVNRARMALDKPTLMEAELWDGPAREIDSGLRVIRNGSPMTTEPREPFWSSLQADVHVDLGADCVGSLELVYFDNFGALGAEASTITMSGALVGAVDIATRDGEARIDGQLDVVRGSAKVVSSYFTIQDGTIVFVDGDPYQPFVNVEASMPLGSGGDVTMSLQGTPAHADVDFASNQISRPEQILTAVITGNDPARSTGGEAALDLASAVVMEAMFGEYDLGNLEYRQGMLQYPLALGPRLRVTPKLGLGTAFSSDLAAVDLGFIASQRLVLQSTLGNATRTVGFVWRKRY